MRSNFFSLITVTILAMCFVLPAFAASATYDFTMVNRVVNGKDNGVYHTLSAGTAHMNGSSFTYSSGPEAVGPYDIKYTLYKDVFGPDPSYGTVNGGHDRSFVGSFANVDASDKYYLLIWKTNIDGHTSKGSGSVFN